MLANRVHSSPISYAQTTRSHDDGYKKLIDCGVDIVAIEHMPYFMPEQAAAAVAAEKHAYMAKPVAVGVPGTLKIGELGKEATRKNLAFMVDYPAPTDPSNAEVRQRVLDGAIGLGFGITGLTT